MKITVDTVNDNKEEIKKVITLLQNIVGDSQSVTSQNSDQVQNVGVENVMAPAQTQSQQDVAPQSSQPIDNSQPQQNPQQPEQSSQSGQDTKGATSAMMGIFDAEVPSNIPLDQLNKMNQDKQDDDDENDNDLGLEIVPY